MSVYVYTTEPFRYAQPSAGECRDVAQPCVEGFRWKLHSWEVNPASGALILMWEGERIGECPACHYDFPQCKCGATEPVAGGFYEPPEMPPFPLDIDPDEEPVDFSKLPHCACGVILNAEERKDGNGHCSECRRMRS